MRETTLVVTAWNLSGPILADLAQLLLPDSAHPSEDEEFVQSVWEEVGDDLRDAMRQYPVSQAAADAAKTLPVSAA